jgi:hypothetical protein
MMKTESRIKGLPRYRARVEQTVSPRQEWTGTVAAANLRSAEIVALSKAALDLRVNARELDVTHCHEVAEPRRVVVSQEHVGLAALAANFNRGLTAS